jgi:RNA recognition motif-containing protein
MVLGILIIMMKVRYHKMYDFAIPQMVTRTKKIFVGGLSAPTTIEDVRTYFEQFGPVRMSPKFLLIYRTNT